MLCKHESFFLTMRKRKQMRYNEFNFNFFFLNVVMDNCYVMNYGNSFFEKNNIRHAQVWHERITLNCFFYFLVLVEKNQVLIK